MTRMFLVQRQAFDGPDHFCNDPRTDGDYGTRVPVAVFPDRPSAEGRRDELLAAAARTINPFVIYEYEDGDDELGHAEFRDRLYAIVSRDTPLTEHPPDDRWGSPDWIDWYDHLQPRLTDAQRVAVWELFAARPLYEVVPIEMED